MRYAGLLLAFMVVAVARGAEPVSFARDIRPILTNHCFKCHGPDVQKGGLDLQNLKSATAKTDSGEPAIVPGKHAKSELLRRVQLPADDPEHMPPKGQLTPKQMDALKAWIDDGATYVEHWAFVSPVKTIKDRKAIDVYVDRELAKVDMKRADEASRATLIRRLSLDLTGLPPTPAEVDAFENDHSPNAYERLVDRLLASPHYGEHLAKMWLDLARYADTNGYEKDERRTIWPYRDWVIAAFNADQPFDQFTRDQLAGDLLPNATREQKIATGFHRNTMTNTEGGTDDEEFRVAAVVDRVNTTMETWMGLTFACAQCHTHKYDPFTHKDYYRLFAFFNSTTDGGRSVAPELPLPTADQETKQRDIKYRIQKAPKFAGPLPVLAVQAELQKLKRTESTLPIPKTLVLEERAKPRETFVMKRGEHKNLGEKVAAGYPAKFGGQPGANRLELAAWLVNENNVLTGRVFANRIWARLFGKGIVETLEDFGVQGEPPSHPELLDWLAVDFAESKWSVKALVKTIVMSGTYRQAATVTAEKLAKDPFNRLMSRGPRFRLDGEAVRDQAIAVAGLLKPTVGGPSVMPYQPDGVWANPYSGDRWVQGKNGDQYRRSLYTFWRRTAPYAMLTAFDAPSREVACSRRPRTNTPLQALATLNDKAFVECAIGLAKRIAVEGKDDPIGFAFRATVARMPSERERAIVARLLETNRWRYAFNPDATKRLTGEASFELAAKTVVANLLLNLDEFVTKP
jgi:mono/diheme cytochrome c family protein